MNKGRRFIFSAASGTGNPVIARKTRGGPDGGYGGFGRDSTTIHKMVNLNCNSKQIAPTPDVYSLQSLDCGDKHGHVKHCRGSTIEVRAQSLFARVNPWVFQRESDISAPIRL